MEILRRTIQIQFLGLIFFCHIAIADVDLSTAINIKDQQNIAQALKKKYQVFYFWATWCPDCKEKMTSDLSSYESTQVELLSVATDKDREKILDYLKANKVSVPVFYDQEKKIQKYFKVFAVPTVILAEKAENGFKVIYQVSGSDWSELSQLVKERK